MRAATSAACRSTRPSSTVDARGEVRRGRPIRPPPTPAVERDIARDMVRRGAARSPPCSSPSAPSIWGRDGACPAPSRWPSSSSTCSPPPALMAWAARISPTVLMAAVLGGFLVRMGLVAARRLRREGPVLGRAAAPRASRCSSPTSASCSGRPATCPRRSPSRPQARRRRPEGGSTRHDARPRVPADQPPHRVARPLRRATPFAVNKVVLLMWLVGRPRGRRSSSSPAASSSSCRPACRTSPSRSSTSSARASSCRRWARTGCGYMPFLLTLFSSSSSATSGRSSRSSRCR